MTTTDLTVDLGGERDPGEHERDLGRLDRQGSRVPARVRIMGWMVLVMAAGLATVVLLVTRSEYAALDNRVNRALEQDAEEFRRFAARGQDQVSGQVITDPQRLFEQHLSGQHTDRFEVLFGVWSAPGGQLRSLRQGDLGGRDLVLDQALLTSIVTSRDASRTSETAAGEMRWLRVDVRPATAAGGEAPMWFVSAIMVGEERAEAHRTVRTLLIVSLLALVLAAAVSWLVAGRILAPVRTVRLAAAALTEDDLTHRIPVHGRDDIAALAEVFNAMLDRLERAFATRRRFLDDAGHELRTPITIVRGHLEVMGDDPAERAEAVRLCTDELDRMARIVDDLLLLARAEQPDFVRPERTSVPDLTLDVVAKLQAIAGRTFVLDAVGEGEAWLDPQRITQAMVQLAQNAVQHTTPGAVIRVGSGLRDGVASFWVADSGPGISPVDLPHIFQRMSRSAASGEGGGTGLGLAIVKAIADAHHGSVDVRSQPGQGATFSIDIPRERTWHGS